MWCEPTAQLSAHGMTVPGRDGVLKVSPWVRIASEAQRAMREVGTEFGSTPLARGRIKAVPPPPPDPFDELLNS
jgi:phage terminase small subunit